jgi:hypothetical protein
MPSSANAGVRISMGSKKAGIVTYADLGRYTQRGISLVPCGATVATSSRAAVAREICPNFVPAVDSRSVPLSPARSRSTLLPII